jgi:hypothetical protein
MIDTLYTNGCSWTAGDELEQDPKFTEYLSQQKLKKNGWSITDAKGAYICPPSDIWPKFNWSGQVAKYLNIPNVINESFGGGSNYRLLRLTCDFLLSYPNEKRKNLLVIIGWTSPDRDEVYIEDKKSWEILNFKDSSFTKDYFTHVFSEFKNIKIYYQQVFLLSNLLENLKIKYFFFNSIFYPNFSYYDTNELKNYIECYKNNNSILSDYNMVQYVSNKKYPVGMYKHPLIDAHEGWAIHLIDIMKHRKIL